MINKPCAIIKRNLNLMINAKLSSVIIFLGPIILMLAIGIALQGTELKSITVGIYADNWKEIQGDKFVEGFEEKVGDFKIEHSLETCKTKVVNNEYDACVEIKRETEYQPIEGRDLSLNTPTYKMINHVDFSKTRMVWPVINRIQRIIELQSQETTQEDVQKIVDQLDSIMENIKVQKDKLIEISVYVQDIEDKRNTIAREVQSAREDVDAIRTDLENLHQLITDPGVAANFGGIYTNLNQLDQTLVNIESSAFIYTGATSVQASDIIKIIASLNEIINQWDSLKGTNLNQISSRVIYNYQSVLDDSKSYNGKSLDSIDYLFPSFLMFFVIFVSLVFPATTIIRERTSKSYIRNATSRTKGINFALFNFISSILIIFVQIFAIIILSNFFLNVNIISNLFSTLILIFLSVGILSLVGVLIGYLFNSHETSIIASISISLMMLIFLPGITPLETLPDFFSKIIKILPSSIFEDKLRISILAGAQISFSSIEIISLTISILVLVSGIILLYLKTKRKEI